MDATLRQHILATQKPEIPWRCEPMLGGYYTDAEFAAVREVMEASNHPHIGFSSGSETILAFEAAFADYCGAAHCVVCNGAGAAQDMAMMVLGIEPGDEVIVPAVNFIACGISAAGQGAKVVWCDVDPRTFQADPADVERRMTERTRAIYPVHMNGMAAPIDDYLEIAEHHPHPKYGPAKVVGDAARSCGAGYKGGKVGSRAWITTFSFHTMKLMTTLGEGGALVTNDADAAAALRKIRGFGGGSRWGTNYKMTNVQAAVGLVQLSRLEQMLAERRRVADERTSLLQGIPELELPFVPEECWHTYYLYTLLAPPTWAGEKRDCLMRMMAEDYGIPCVVANPPCYLGHAWMAEQTAGQRLPFSEELGRRLFCPPIHPLMSTQDNEYICAALWESVARVASLG